MIVMVTEYHRNISGHISNFGTSIFIEGENKWLVLLKKAVEYQKAKYEVIA